MCHGRTYVFSHFPYSECHHVDTFVFVFFCEHAAQSPLMSEKNVLENFNLYAPISPLWGHSAHVVRHLCGRSPDVASLAWWTHWTQWTLSGHGGH